jgi:hypothetical protein
MVFVSHCIKFDGSKASFNYDKVAVIPIPMFVIIYSFCISKVYCLRKKRLR